MKKSKKKLEIVLLKEEASLGKKGDKIEVAKGYAINYLIPYDFAVFSSDPRAAAILRETKKKKKLKKAQIEKAEKVVEKIKDLRIEIKKKVGAKDKLFGSVTESNILKELEKRAKIKLGKKEIIGKLPIKKVGNYKIKIKLASSVEPEIMVRIIGEAKKKKGDK